jgi:hypothetical protein
MSSKDNKNKMSGRKQAVELTVFQLSSIKKAPRKEALFL